jgi:hypothetical protein
MKRIFTSLFVGIICLSGMNAYAEVPAGYTSIVDLVGATDVYPKEVAQATSFQFLGPASGWGNNADNDFTGYKTLAVAMSYDALNAGKQVAFRFNVNPNTTPDDAEKNVKVVIITLPEGSTSYVAKINIEQYKGTGLTTTDPEQIKVGGMILYAGASHFSFTYDGTAVTEAPVTVDYIAVSQTLDVPNAVKENSFVNPDALVDVYSLTGAVVRKNVKNSEATLGLTPGIYLVGGRKVIVNKQ